MSFTRSLEKLFFQHSHLCVVGAKITASEVFSGGNLHASCDNVIVQPSRKLQLEPSTLLWPCYLCSHATGPRRSAGWFLFGTNKLLTWLFDIFRSNSAVLLRSFLTCEVVIDVNKLRGIQNVGNCPAPQQPAGRCSAP